MWRTDERECMADAQIEVYDYSEDLKRAWWLMLVSGVFSLAIGGFLIFSPKATITVITMVVGIFMIVTGVIRFLVAVFDSEAAERWLTIFQALPASSSVLSSSRTLRRRLVSSCSWSQCTG